jgi:bifunctional UDP-N-acetylglucosamine pyrophosphorylase/glucosamine-1-phosphate N-acetyltransferase
MSLAVIILAAGRGTRMHSDRPKVLHPIGGKPLLGHLIETVSHINPTQLVVVYGFQGEQLKAAFSTHPAITWVEQREQQGTGHAVLQALPFLDVVDHVLILYGDAPLITGDTIRRLQEKVTKNTMGLITLHTPNPQGLGRIVRDDAGKLIRIVEEKEATSAQKQISEINTGFFIVPKVYLERWLPNLSPQNAQEEYYLSDIVAHANQENITIQSIQPETACEVMGVNDKVQLATLERFYQQREANRLMQQGVMLLDPMRFDVRGDVSVGKDVSIDVNVILQGQVIIKDRVTIGSNVLIKDTVIENDVHILANSVIEGAHIGTHATVGPFARIRKGTVLDSEARVGNFVEIKNATIGVSSKINHLSYIGDAAVGNHVNIGAGTITCNFDGRKKHKTVINNGVFVGSGTQLIAPVEIGEKATIGAGTTVTKNVLANTLVHNRLEQRSVPNWRRTEEE